MGRWKQDLTIEKSVIVDFILYLYEGYLKFGHDKNTNHIIYIAVRDITRIIGLANKKISKRAKRSSDTIKDHKKPAILFFEEFTKKRFTKKDAKRWIDEAIITTITKEEDALLTSNGWRDKNRPPDAYEKLGIELEDDI
jgi:hypothetical protein